MELQLIESVLAGTVLYFKWIEICV